MKLPESISLASEQHYETLCQHNPHITQWSDALLRDVKRVIGLSDFILEALIRDEALVNELPSLVASNQRSREYRHELNAALANCSDEASVMRALRHFRNREMVYIAWRDFLATWDLKESLSHLSELAEAILFETYHWHYQKACQEWGTPVNADGEAQPMLIIGMGKLGGGELNFSSDIDLIFTYPDNGETQGARRSIANAVFFTRLGQRIIKALDQMTQDGFCYRVDMRLRPFGQSGPLVMSFAALEDYYQEQGRDWQRYAMVKARVMGREMYACYQTLRGMLRPFVFRRYIDFSALQSLRKMKAMIQAEVRRRGLQDNIKLGAGGIREIEFIIQVFQLIRGGREPSLRKRGLLETLDAIEHLELLAKEEASALRDAYCFLRRVENLLQAIGDKQTQTLPDKTLDRERLAFALGEAQWDSLYTKINAHMANVNGIFHDLIGEESGEGNEESHHDQFDELWELLDVHQEDALHIIAELVDTDDAPPLLEQLLDFKQELNRKTLGPRGRDVLGHLMPKLLRTQFAHPDAQFGLARTLVVLQSIATRTTYLELLDENSGALTQLVRLCTASPMISEQLSKYPVLLDELIDPHHLYQPIALSDYPLELRDYLARIPRDDMEQQMEALRQFKQICLLKIAAADIVGALPIMKVSDHLTYLAEAIIHEVVDQAWQQMSEKFGLPTHLQQRGGRGFCVIGYGKLGGWELGYQSDLDVVFTHDCSTNVYTDGAKEIDGRQFYMRLAQRIVHIFSARTPSGILYEVDTRLRPSGASGVLAPSMETFAEYQEKEAWTWEHQSLVRARVVYGDDKIAEQFVTIRHHILSLARDELKLRQEIVEMREKMVSHLGGKKAGRFMLKQDPGGITDIEFLAQYLVLKFSASYPKLTQWSDNIRIFESLAQADVMSSDEQQALSQCYTTLRDEIHRRNLLNLSADVADDKFNDIRQQVTQSWQRWMAV